MSFILDALRKSETERQQQGAAEFVGVPLSADAPRAPRWLWFLGALLVINLAVLVGVLMRPDTAPQLPVAISSAPTSTSPDSQVTFAERLAEERANQAARETRTTSDAKQPKAVPTVQQSPPALSVQSLLTFDEARARGTLQLADLHLDIHVYGQSPADRFVFINMVKHREGSRLDEGPGVREITPEGVILDYQGTVFLLPRE